MSAVPQQATAGGARVRSVVEEVLSRPEFEGDSNPLENLLGSALGDFFEWLFGLMPDIGVSSGSAELLGIVLAVLAGVGLVLLLVRCSVRVEQPPRLSARFSGVGMDERATDGVLPVVDATPTLQL